MLVGCVWCHEMRAYFNSVTQTMRPQKLFENHRQCDRRLTARISYSISALGFTETKPVHLSLETAAETIVAKNGSFAEQAVKIYSVRAGI